jgi:hypothetical protein
MEGMGHNAYLGFRDGNKPLFKIGKGWHISSFLKTADNYTALDN